MRILAIGSHPDDIEVGCGGTLTKYSKEGHEIYLLVMTEGEQGGAEKIRKTEQEKAAKLVKAKKLFWGKSKDTEIHANLETIQIIEKIIKTINPVFIFTHYHDDTHQDHRHLSSAVTSAARYTKNVLFYEGPTTHGFQPTIFIDINEVLEEKVALVKAHASQVERTNITGLSIVDIVLSSANFRGVQGRVKNAEAFVPVRMFINITE